MSAFLITSEVMSSGQYAFSVAFSVFAVFGLCYGIPVWEFTVMLLPASSSREIHAMLRICSVSVCAMVLSSRTYFSASASSGCASEVSTGLVMAVIRLISDSLFSFLLMSVCKSFWGKVINPRAPMIDLDKGALMSFQVEQVEQQEHDKLQQV
jgi:hypothetical protein